MLRERGCDKRIVGHMEKRSCTDRTIVPWKRVTVPEKVVMCKDMPKPEEVTTPKGDAKQAEESIASFRGWIQPTKRR